MLGTALSENREITFSSHLSNKLRSLHRRFSLRNISATEQGGSTSGIAEECYSFDSQHKYIAIQFPLNHAFGVKNGARAPTVRLVSIEKVILLDRQLFSVELIDCPAEQ
jgi:hypothetical protein